MIKTINSKEFQTNLVLKVITNHVIRREANVLFVN